MIRPSLRILLMIFLLTACTGTRPVAGGDLSEAEIGQVKGEGLSKAESIAPRGFHEACLTLEPDQSVAYGFSTSLPAHFNIHFHEGDEVVYPVSLKDVVEFDGIFQPTSTRHYCLMWQNVHSTSTELTYRLRMASGRE